MAAETLYCVRFWVSPEGREAVMQWLDGHHMQDVVSQPGFRWMKRLKLAQDADDGWLGSVGNFVCGGKIGRKDPFHGASQTTFHSGCPA
jgi:hypothetical protein